MDDLLKLVKTYRLTTGLAERLRLAEEVFTQVEPDLRFFVFGSITPPAAEDVLQDTLKAIVTDLAKFQGGSAKEFWAWCYRIARNKLNDHYRRQAADRMQPMPADDLRELIESSSQATPLSPGDRHDLDFALQLLTNAKPECYELLWRHFVIGLDYAEIAEEHDLTYDAARMKIGRCLDTAQSLVS